MRVITGNKNCFPVVTTPPSLCDKPKASETRRWGRGTRSQPERLSTYCPNFFRTMATSCRDWVLRSSRSVTTRSGYVWPNTTPKERGEQGMKIYTNSCILWGAIFQNKSMLLHWKNRLIKNIVKQTVNFLTRTSKHRRGTFPGFVNKLIRQICKFRAPFPDIAAAGVTGHCCVNGVHDKVPVIQTTHAPVLPHHSIYGNICIH